MAKSINSMTKKELIESYKKKTNTASPLVKKVAHKNLQYQNKRELRRLLAKARVTKSGDINYG